MNLNIAMLCVCILILFAVASKMVINEQRQTSVDKVLCKKNVFSGEFPSFYPTGSKNILLTASANNTPTQRPGSGYDVVTWGTNSKQPAFRIKLLYKPECLKHGLVALFEDIAKTMMADGTAVTSSIEFERVLVDSTNPFNLLGGFPKIIKIRRDGQVMEYKGYTDYAPLYDWILNEGILY